MSVPATEGHKAAGWPELFGDLIFVSIIQELTHFVVHAIMSSHTGHRLLSDGDHGDDEDAHGDDSSEFLFGWSEIGESVAITILFGAVAWQVWVIDMTASARTSGGKDMLGRVLNLIFMGSLVFMSANIHGGTDSLMFSYVCWSGAVAKMVCMCKYSRLILNDKAAAPLKNVVLAQVPSIATDLAAGFVAQSGHREAAFFLYLGSIVYLVTLMMSSWAFGGLGSKESREAYYLMTTTLDNHYLVERFGLLQIIIVGETVMQVVAGAKMEAGLLESTYLGQGFLVAMMFVVIYSNYWVYFDSVDGAGDITHLHKRAAITVLLHEGLMFANIFLAAGINVMLTQTGYQNAGLSRATVDITCYGYAWLCAIQSSIKLVSTYSARIIKENKRAFALRIAFTSSAPIVLAIIPSFVDTEKSFDPTAIIGGLFAIAVIRILSIFVSDAWDWFVLQRNGGGGEEGEEGGGGVKEKPLLVPVIQKRICKPVEAMETDRKSSTGDSDVGSFFSGVLGQTDM
ncbi:hypothetical protein TeGR_g13792 [Tetraparma gracilis]|nr:hypothetical protein TeGR_g13792 [Tetraparma gracilis]